MHHRIMSYWSDFMISQVMLTTKLPVKENHGLFGLLKVYFPSGKYSLFLGHSRLLEIYNLTELGFFVCFGVAVYWGGGEMDSV